MATSSTAGSAHSIPWRVFAIGPGVLLVILAVLALTVGFGGHSSARPATHTSADNGSYCVSAHPGKVC